MRFFKNLAASRLRSYNAGRSTSLTSHVSQRIQKCNELLALFGLKIQSEGMARNSSGVRAEWSKSAGYMGFFEPVWIEHLFQARH